MGEIEIVGIVNRGFPNCQLMVTLRIEGDLKQMFVPYEDTDFMPDPFSPDGVRPLTPLTAERLDGILDNLPPLTPAEKRDV